MKNSITTFSYIKKISLLAVFFLNTGLIAQNLDNGNYKCVFTALADNNWNVLKQFPKEQMKKSIIGLVVKNNTITSANEKYELFTKTKEGTEIYYYTKADSAIVTPTYTSKEKNSLFGLGFSIHISNNEKTKRFLLGCKKE